jgi:hypothetical protein
MVMMPMQGMTGGYASVRGCPNGECCLRVEVVSYKEFMDRKYVTFRVLRDADEEKNSGPKCNLNVGDEFVYPMQRKDGKKELESFILDEEVVIK